MGRSLSGTAHFHRTYFPDQPSNVVWLARKAKTGTAGFSFKYLILLEDGDPVELGLGEFESLFGLDCGGETQTIPPNKTPSKIFDRLAYSRKQYTYGRTLVDYYKPDVVSKIYLQASGEYQFHRNDWPALMAFINKSLPPGKQLRLDEAGTPRLFTTPEEARRFGLYGLDAKLDQTATTQARSYLIEKAVKQFLPALALDLLYHAIVCDLDVMDVWEIDEGWEKQIW